jgi:Papain family cysteine protease
LSVAEFKQRLGGRFDDSANKTYLPISNEPVANDFDWRNAGAVGYPKDQG